MSIPAWLATAAALTCTGVVLSAQTPAPPDPNRRLLALKEFRLESGMVLPVAQVAYAAFGVLNAARDNAVLVPSYYGADYHGYDFLIGPGKALDPARHGVVVIDSISHPWDACKAAYAGRVNRNGAIPFQAWTAIKKPYRELMHWLLTSPIHVLICGRQGVDYTEDDAGELKNAGFKMRAEGETAYEPDVLLRLESRRDGKRPRAVPVAHVEKDRTGVQAGKSIEWPGFDAVARPLLGLLGTTQSGMPTDDEVGLQDAEALARDEADRTRRSAELAAEYAERFAAAESLAELQRIGHALTAQVKALFTAKDLQRVRKTYGMRQAQLQPGGVASGAPAPAG